MTDTKPSDVDGLIEALRDLVDCGCLEGKLECATRAATTLSAQQARIEALAHALVTAMIPIEAIVASGADATHCQDVRDALHDAVSTARAAMETPHADG